MERVSVWARLFDALARWHTGSRYVQARRADANGAFRVSELPPGDYWIVVIDRFEQGKLQNREMLGSLA